MVPGVHSDAVHDPARVAGEPFVKATGHAKCPGTLEMLSIGEASPITAGAPPS